MPPLYIAVHEQARLPGQSQVKPSKVPQHRYFYKELQGYFYKELQGKQAAVAVSVQG